MYCRGKEAEKLFVSPPSGKEEPCRFGKRGGPSENGGGVVTF